MATTNQFMKAVIDWRKQDFNVGHGKLVKAICNDHGDTAVFLVKHAPLDKGGEPTFSVYRAFTMGPNKEIQVSVDMDMVSIDQFASEYFDLPAVFK